MAGIYIEVLGHSDRMFGCLGNLVMCLPPRWWRQAAPRGELAVCLGGSQEQLLKYIYVLILSDNVICRNYEYNTVCDIYMCYSMDLSMYSDVLQGALLAQMRSLKF